MRKFPISFVTISRLAKHVMTSSSRKLLIASGENVMQATFESGESISLDFCGDYLKGSIGGYTVKWNLNGDIINRDELPEWVVEVAETAKI
jgi:hypothetical protein